MHLPIVILHAVDKPLSSKELQNIKEENLSLEDCYNYCRHGFDYVGYEYEELDSNNISSIYDDHIFELVKKDEEHNINHVFRIKPGALEYISKQKITQLNTLMSKITPDNFKQYYSDLENAIIEKFDTFIAENDAIYLLDEWLLSEAEEGQLYQIIQAFDSHL